VGTRSRLVLLALALVAALFCAAVLVASASAAAGSGSISGKVTDASTLEPVAGVEVCAESTSEETYSCDVTDSLGEYRVLELGTGDYKVEFWPLPGPLNYVPQYFDGKSSWQQANLVHVTNGFDAPGTNAALAKGGWIEGRVTDAVTKAGLSEVFVCALPIDEEGFGRCGSTDFSGNYTLYGLASDAYEVDFYPEDGDHLFQAYNGKANWFEATPVNVTAGTGRTAINAELARAGHITGTVTDAVSGTGIRFAAVCLYTANGEEPEYCVPTDGSGHYSLGGLPTGAYRVGFSLDEYEKEEPDNYFPQFYNGKPDLGQSDLIPVTAPNTTSGIDAHLVNRSAPPSPPAATPPSSPPPPTPLVKHKHKHKKNHCRRGFKRVRVHGKPRCLRIQRHHKPHRHHH
jgi:carboxypeptidase family protein